MNEETAKRSWTENATVNVLPMGKARHCGRHSSRSTDGNPHLSIAEPKTVFFGKTRTCAIRQGWTLFCFRGVLCSPVESKKNGHKNKRTHPPKRQKCSADFHCTELESLPSVNGLLVQLESPSSPTNQPSTLVCCASITTCANLNSMHPTQNRRCC